MIGYAMCGSFCTVKKSMEVMKRLVENEYQIQPIMSEILYGSDTRFGKAEEPGALPVLSGLRGFPHRHHHWLCP